MLIKVSLSKLKPGVFIEEDKLKPYANIFPNYAFKIESETQINQLKTLGFNEIHINVHKGLDVASGEDAKQFIGFPIDVLLINEKLSFDLLIKEEKGYVTYLRKGQDFNDEVYYFLSNEYHHDRVYVRAKEKEIFHRYAERYKKERALSEKGLAVGFETKEKVQKYQDYLNNYIPVNKDLFEFGTKSLFDLYTEKELDIVKVVSINEKIPENELFSTSVKGNKENNNLLIHKKDVEQYKAFIRNLLDSKSDLSEQKEKIKITVMKENSKLVTKELMENPRSGEALAETKNLVSDMVATIIEHPTSFHGLMKLETYDYYTYLHSVNVCTLSVGLGMILGLNKKELEVLAIGALMHDVGKSVVPSELINKPGKLTDEEFNLIKKHVDLGYQALKYNLDIPKESFYSLMQHHEKMDGSGYPKRLSGNQIHLYGRILSIVDIYDALTTERSYKKAFRPFDAVTILKKNPEAFDQKVFKEFVLMLGKQMLHE
ncbi:MAG: HD-GYP domain-containing protein [Nitrospinae bacterium]|nr:HD-GYP domain-containing protein [Nitrospinota bacterium]